MRIGRRQQSEPAKPGRWARVVLNVRLLEGEDDYDIARIVEASLGDRETSGFAHFAPEPRAQSEIEAERQRIGAHTVGELFVNFYGHIFRQTSFIDEPTAHFVRLLGEGEELYGSTAPYDDEITAPPGSLALRDLKRLVKEEPA